MDLREMIVGRSPRGYIGFEKMAMCGDRHSEQLSNYEEPRAVLLSGECLDLVGLIEWQHKRIEELTAVVDELEGAE